MPQKARKVEVEVEGGVGAVHEKGGMRRKERQK